MNEEKNQILECCVSVRRCLLSLAPLCRDEVQVVVGKIMNLFDRCDWQDFVHGKGLYVKGQQNIRVFVMGMIQECKNPIHHDHRRIVPDDKTMRPVEVER